MPISSEKSSYESTSTPFAARIIRDNESENLEFPFSSLNSAITPTEQFFIRSHFPVPKLNPQNYRLKLDGYIERPLELTYDGLLKMPSTQVTMPGLPLWIGAILVSHLRCIPGFPG